MGLAAIAPTTAAHSGRSRAGMGEWRSATAVGRGGAAAVVPAVSTHGALRGKHLLAHPLRVVGVPRGAPRGLGAPLRGGACGGFRRTRAREWGVVVGATPAGIAAPGDAGWDGGGHLPDPTHGRFFCKPSWLFLVRCGARAPLCRIDCWRAGTGRPREESPGCGLYISQNDS